MRKGRSNRASGDRDSSGTTGSFVSLELCSVVGTSNGSFDSRCRTFNFVIAVLSHGVFSHGNGEGSKWCQQNPTDDDEIVEQSELAKQQCGEQ